MRRQPPPPAATHNSPASRRLKNPTRVSRKGKMILLGVAVAAAILIYCYLTLNSDYWAKKGVPFVPPIPIFGNLRSLIMLQKSPGSFMSSIHNAPQAVGQRFLGMFLCNMQPALVVRDPELIKQIIVKDFAHFHNRNVYCDPHTDPIGHNNLFVLRDEKWKYLRSKLSPIFTSGKIKNMFKLISVVSDELIVNIDNRLKNSEKAIEIKELAAKFTTDVISTCAFGIQANSLNDPKSQFRAFGRNIFSISIFRSLEVRAIFFMHWFVNAFKVVMFSKASTEFFKGVFWEALNEREKSGQVRHDFLDTLLQLKQDAADKLAKSPDKPEIFEFEGDSLVAQSVLFFTAGFETTATTIASTLTELACAPDIQDKLRKEILENIESHEGQLTYDGLFEMKYLDKVVCEVLRKYPAMPFVDRVCTKEYKIPGSDVVIEKGTPLFISLYKGLHHDTDNFPDPERFDPERFSDRNKNERHPFSWIPFGEGPHICIGMRFAMMSVKSAVSRLLVKYRVEPTEAIKMPLKLNERSIILSIEGGLPLKFSQL